MTANPYRPSGKINIKDLIEEMREEIAIEKGLKYVKPVDKPKGKPKTPANPDPKRPKKPKKDNIFAKKGGRRLW